MANFNLGMAYCAGAFIIVMLVQILRTLAELK